MKATNYKYDFKDSLQRIYDILNAGAGAYEERDEIPNTEELTYSNGFYVNCSAVFIDICNSSSLPGKHTRPVLAKIYRSFISECVSIMNAQDSCREVNIQGDCVWGIFNTPFKADIEQLVEMMAKLSSLINILNYKLQEKKYSTYMVGIGADYGRALMIKAGYKGSGINDVVYMGDVVNRASHLSGFGNETYFDKTIMVSPAIYGNLSEGYQKYFNWNANHQCYHAGIINTEMDEWIKKQENK